MNQTYLYQNPPMIHQIGDTFIRVDKIIAIKLNNVSSRGPINVVNLILSDDILDIEIVFKDHEEAKEEVEKLIKKIDLFYSSDRK